MSLAEGVAEDVLDRLERFPPSSLLFALFQLCEAIDEPDHPTLRQAISLWFRAVVQRLPESFTTTRLQYYTARDWDTPYSGPSVPLSELIDIGDCILSVQGHFQEDYHRLMDLDLCNTLRAQLRNNNAAAHSLSLYQVRRTRVPGPHELDWEPERLIESFLKDTPFRDFFYTQVPFRIPRSLWPSHMFALAGSGWGKSQLLGTIFREAIEDPYPRTVILFDPHAQKPGSVFELALERVPRDRLVVIDPSSRSPPEIGLMDFGVLSQHDALETFRFLLSSLAQGLSPKQETALPSLFELLSKIPNASLVTLHEIITEQKQKGQSLKYADAIAQLDDVHRDFFDRLFYSGNYQETKDALQWKLLAALGRPTFKKMFSATSNSISMDAFLERPTVVLVNGAEQSLGKEGMRIFLLFLIGQYYAAAKRRKARHLAMCLVDEAWMVLQSPLIADMLVELRGFNCSLVCMTQIWSQVAEPVRPAILGSTAIKAVGAIQHNDASVFSNEMFTTVQNIRGLKPYYGPGSSAQWAVHLTGMSKAQVVSVPYGTLAAMPKQREPYRPQTREAALTVAATASDTKPAPCPAPPLRDYAKEQQGDATCHEPAMKKGERPPVPDDDHIRPIKE